MNMVKKTGFWAVFTEKELDLKNFKWKMSKVNQNYSTFRLLIEAEKEINDAKLKQIVSEEWEVVILNVKKSEVYYYIQVEKSSIKADKISKNIFINEGIIKNMSWKAFYSRSLRKEVTKLRKENDELLLRMKKLEEEVSQIQKHSKLITELEGEDIEWMC